ncbi:hypothetical protein Esti_003826 [Eimeria stiedai]
MASHPPTRLGGGPGGKVFGWLGAPLHEAQTVMGPLRAREPLSWGPPAFRGAPRLTVLLPLQQKAQQQVESGQCCSSTSSSNTRGGSSSNGSTSSSSSSSTARNSSSKVEARVRGSEHPVSALTNNNSSSSSKVYRQPEGFIDFVFKWGVGNAFRAQNANRYRPVHVARERSVSLPKDYFASPLSSVSFEPLNEAWEVVFYENQKKSSKPFPVKKWGVKRAKMEAIAFAEQMQAAGRLEAPKHESDVPANLSTWASRCLLSLLPLLSSHSVILPSPHLSRVSYCLLALSLLASLCTTRSLSLPPVSSSVFSGPRRHVELFLLSPSPVSSCAPACRLLWFSCILSLSLSAPLSTPCLCSVSHLLSLLIRFSSVSFSLPLLPDSSSVPLSHPLLLLRHLLGCLGPCSVSSLKSVLSPSPSPPLSPPPSPSLSPPVSSSVSCSVSPSVPPLSPPLSPPLYPVVPFSVCPSPCSCFEDFFVFTGVFWDGLTSSWVCLLQINGLPTSRSFSAETHGFQQAKLLAVQRATLYQEKQEQQQQQEEQQQKQ